MPISNAELVSQVSSGISSAPSPAGSVPCRDDSLDAENVICDLYGLRDEAEFGAIDPHPMEDDGYLSGECDFGTLGPSALGDSDGPCLELRPVRAACQHQVCRFEQGDADGSITGSADGAARLMAPLRSVSPL